MFSPAKDFTEGRKKLMKKFVSLLLALIMVLSLGSAVFAAMPDFSMDANGTVYKIDGYVSQGTLVQILKNRSLFMEIAANKDKYIIIYGNKPYTIKEYDAATKDAQKKNPTLMEEGKIDDAMIFGQKPLPEGATPITVAKEYKEEVAPAGELEVISISAINTKTIGVNFKSGVAAEDQAKLTYEVKKGNVAMIVTPNFAEDGMSVNLAKSTNFTAGEYDVRVLYDAKEIHAGKVTFETEKAVSIEIVNDTLPSGDTEKLDYKVLNQYGDEMLPAPNLNVVFLNKTDSTRTVSSASLPTVDTSSAKNGDEIQITLVLQSDPTVKATKIIKIADILIDKIEITGPVYPDEKTAARRGDVVKFTVKAYMGKEEVALTNEDWTNNTAAQGLIPMFNATELKNVSLKEGELSVTVAPAAKAGEKSISVVDPYGNVYTAKFEVQVVKAVGLEVAKEPNAQVQTDASTAIQFNVLLEDGSKLTGADLSHKDFNSLVINISKASGANTTFTAPNSGASVVAANILNPITITGGDKGSDTIKFQLSDGSNDIGEAYVYELEAVASITGYKASLKGETKVAVGTPVEVTITANPKAYTFTDTVKITWDGKDYYVKDVQFVDGVATVTFKPMTVQASPATVKVEVGSLPGTTTETLATTFGEVVGYKITTTDNKEFKVEAINKFGMTNADYEETVVLEFTADPEVYFDSLPSGNTSAEFASGSASVALTTTAIQLGTVITVEGNGLTGSITLK